MMWIRTQDGCLLNMDSIVSIKHKDCNVIAKTASASYIIAAYNDETDALAVVNNLASWINKPTASCVFFMPEREDMS